MPPSMDFHHLTQMIERRYPELEPWFRMGRISEIERVESDIASLVMEIFTYDLKRPVLPVHDSFIVAQQDEQVLALAMGYAFHKTIKAWTGINAWPCIHGMSDSDLRTHVYERLFRLR